MNSAIQIGEYKFLSARDKIYNSITKPCFYNNKNNNCCSENSMTEIKVKLKLSEILSDHNKTFLEEKNKLPLKYSTEVEYKEGSSYKKYKLEISENRLIIIKYISKLNKINEDDRDTETNPMQKPTKFLIEDYYHPILSLDFNLITAGITLIKEQMEIIIYVLGSNLSFRMRVNNKEIFDKMTYAISLAISTSKGAKMNLLAITMRHKWHFNYFITNEDFMNIAKTGDMLIFRGNEFPSTFQRSLTWNEYDHVVFLQKSNNILYLFEATSREGCKLQTWKDYLSMLWNLIYEKIVYRELIINSPQKDNIQSEIEKKTETFIQSTNRKKYNLNVCSIICCTKKIDYEKRNQWGQSKGFTCSSLLAAAYINLNVIPYQKDTSSYLPGQFAEKANIAMNEPFAFGPEVIIDFST